MASENKPLVSFVVTSYNHARYLTDCINSILDQTGNDDFEIVLVDDASSDNTGEVIKSFHNSRIRTIFHRNNRGLVATLNEGLLNAQGTFIAHIDSDDRYRPRFLTTTLEIFRKFPTVGLVYGDLALMDENGNVSSDPSDYCGTREIHQGKDFKGNEHARLLSRNFITSTTIIARKGVWNDALPIPDWISPNFPATDWYLNLKMSQKHEFYYIACTLADFRIHPQNLHRKMAGDRSVEVTAFQILDRFFSEKDFVHRQKWFQRKVYADGYLNFADKYFGLSKSTDFRRCYWRALFYRPDYVFKLGPLRRFFGTFVGQQRYNQCKEFYQFLKKRLALQAKK